MNHAAAPLRDLAARLLAEERDSSDSVNEPAAHRVCGKLGALISKLAGAAGYRSLLTRALALAQAKAPELKSVRVSPDGLLEGFAEANTGTDTEQLAPGEVAIVAQLLGLLTTFIGEPLTRQLVKEAWPAIAPLTSSASHTA